MDSDAALTWHGLASELFKEHVLKPPYFVHLLTLGEVEAFVLDEVFQTSGLGPQPNSQSDVRPGLLVSPDAACPTRDDAQERQARTTIARIAHCHGSDARRRHIIVVLWTQTHPSVRHQLHPRRQEQSSPRRDRRMA